jgi:PAS domain S-box-containing protein
MRWRVGRRGCVLLFLAFLGVAISQSLGDPDELTRRNPIYQTIDSLAPLKIWAVVWLLIGLLCIVQAFARNDRLAFAASSSLLTVWGMLFGYAWIIHNLPRGAVGAAVWLAFAALVTVISTWAETPDVSSGGPAGFDASTNAIITIDSDGTVLSWNPAAQEFFGWQAAEVINRPVSTIIPDRYRHAHEAGLARVRASGRAALAGKELHLPALCRDGTERPVRLTLTTWMSTGGLRITGIISPLPEAHDS